jgi:ligand-binding SRPBCC domain-containing protein
MATLVIETEIDAPPGICFDLVRDISLHIQTTSETSEKAVAGKTHGKIALGETVTFEGKHFGIRQRLTVKVTEFEEPQFFTDEMIEGTFDEFKHKHEFLAEGDGTLMRDTLVWTSPFGVLGRIVDALLIKNHLRKLVTRRNLELKKIAESRSKDCP